jgi:tRNA pseudouridine55 synthase
MTDYVAGQILLLNKPLDWTSFDVVNKLRYALRPIDKKIKVGHAGTLDPKATGLLLICTGAFTKKIESLQGLDKEYTGTFFLGATTECYDTERPVNATFPTEHITPELIFQTAASFLGQQEQMPPAHSAIKIGGKIAYNLARKGKDVELKTRSVVIHEFEITRIALPEVDFRVKCSKGTYIRSLAHDFGQRLNSGAYLAALQRTAIGAYRIEDAQDLEELVSFIRQELEAKNANS